MLLVSHILLAAHAPLVTYALLVTYAEPSTGRSQIVSARSGKGSERTRLQLHVKSLLLHKTRWKPQSDSRNAWWHLTCECRGKQPLGKIISKFRCKPASTAESKRKYKYRDAETGASRAESFTRALSDVERDFKCLPCF